MHESNATAEAEGCVWPPRTEVSWPEERAVSVRFLRPSFLEPKDELNIDFLVLPLLLC
jgi:hypothetical protein